MSARQATPRDIHQISRVVFGIGLVKKHRVPEHLWFRERSYHPPTKVGGYGNP